MQVDCSTQFNEIIASARRVSVEMGESVEAVLRAGLANPLPPVEARRLLVRVVEVMRTRATARGAGGLDILDEDIEDLVRRATEAQAQVGEAPSRRVLQLASHDGIDPHPVLPSPVFHERSVQVRQGFVRTRDIRLWDENVRLDIHLAQFRAREAREPEDDELLDIMLGRAGLEGVTENDQFKIRGLARSIAVNGVRKAPILDTDGTLLDGNRRVTACQYILNSSGNEFTSAEKARVEWLLVWQLTEHATEADREAVVVSLNFEEDHKEEWPKYVKAQKVYEEWQEMLVLEPRSPPPAARVRTLRQDLARKFALATDDVSKYIEMVKLAQDFEDHQAGDRGRDPHAVKHRAAKAFEYFDELGKGRNPGGVNHALNQDDIFKHLVYDLLYDGKFKNWNKIRDLKYVYGNDAATDLLRRARDSSDVEEAEDLVEQACAHARDVRREQREVGVNMRIKAFCDWFEGVPLGVFGQGHKNSVTPANLHRLHDVLALVESHLVPSEEGAAPGEQVPNAA